MSLADRLGARFHGIKFRGYFSDLLNGFFPCLSGFHNLLLKLVKDRCLNRHQRVFTKRPEVFQEGEVIFRKGVKRFAVIG
jgi:hypothetical protein